MSEPAITGEQFEREYAERSGVTIEELRRYRTYRRCDCGEEGCEGWQMVSHRLAAEMDRENERFWRSGP